MIVANSTAFRIEEIVPPALGIPAIVIEQGGKFIHAKRKTITDRSGTYTTYVDSTGKRVRISGPLTIRVDTGNVSILSEDRSHLGPMVSKKPQAYNPFSPRENQQTPSKDIALPSKAMPQTPPENSSSTFTVYVPPSSEISREPLMSTFADVDTFMARESTTVMLNPTINFTQEDHDNAQKFLEEEAEKAAWDVLTSEEKQRTLLVRDLIKKNPALEKL